MGKRTPFIVHTRMLKITEYIDPDKLQNLMSYTMRQLLKTMDFIPYLKRPLYCPLADRINSTATGGGWHPAGSASAVSMLQPTFLDFKITPPYLVKTESVLLTINVKERNLSDCYIYSILFFMCNECFFIRI